MSPKSKIIKSIFKEELQSNNKENIIYTSFLETDRYILEQVTDATDATDATHGIGSHFFLYDKELGTTEKVDEFVTEDKTYSKEITYLPIVDDLIREKVILLPSDIEEYESTDKLVADIQAFLSSYFELPKFYEKFIPYLALFYWTYERFPFVPYLHFVGRTGTGKSTAMEVFGSICYKPIDASGAITMSSIFRTASKWRGTLLLDEFNASGDNYGEMISFLKSGVSNKAILRVEGDKEREVRAYMIKCPKMFTSEDPITDAGLQSRTMVIKMEKNVRKIPLYRLPRYERAAQSLRNKLLLWRFRNLNKIDLSSMEYGFPELEAFDRRVQQVITPIFFFSNEDTRKDILAFAKEQQEETLRGRRESLNGLIFQEIVENYPTNLTVVFITSQLNKEKGGKFDFTEKKVANVIRKILGFDIVRVGHDNIRTVIADDYEKIKELCVYYGLQVPLPPAGQVASVAEVADDDLRLENIFK